MKKKVKRRVLGRGVLISHFDMYATSSKEAIALERSMFPKWPWMKEPFGEGRLVWEEFKK